MWKFDQFASGVHADEFTVWTASAQSEESIRNKIQLNSMYGTMSRTPPFKKVSAWRYSNGETWYTVSMRKDVSIWFREQFNEQGGKMWRATSDTNWTSVRTEMNEKLYIMLELRWS